MRLNVAKLRGALVQSEMSYRQIAEKYGISRAFLYRTMNGDGEPGRKFLGFMLKFCRDYDLNFMDFVILDD